MKNKNTDYLENSLKDFLVDAGFSSSITPIDEITDKANVMATVGITGDKVGFLTLSMELNNAVKLSRGFAELMEIPIISKEFSDSHIEALSELSNQIAGRVVMYMEDNDLNCSITPPTVLSGGNISINHKTLNNTYFFKAHGQYGFFYITIGLK